MLKSIRFMAAAIMFAKVYADKSDNQPTDKTRVFTCAMNVLDKDPEQSYDLQFEGYNINGSQ